jgi:hypothetical protein
MYVVHSGSDDSRRGKAHIVKDLEDEEGGGKHARTGQHQTHR